MRRISYELRGFIDTPENVNTLSHVIEVRAHRRLQDFVDTTLAPTNVDFLQALIRFIKHRGFGASLEHQLYDLRSFANVWYFFHRDVAQGELRSLASIRPLLASVALKMPRLHAQSHEPHFYLHAGIYLNPGSRMGLEEFEEGTLDWLREVYSWTDELLSLIHI